MPAKEVETEQPALEMDPVLLDIFSKETTGHLKVVNDYLDACEGHTPPFDVTENLHRACHTLHGSANMANVGRGVAVAGALNRFIRRVYDHKIGFQQSGLGALRAAAKAIATIVGEINQPEPKRADYTALIDHITNLANAVMPVDAVEPEVVKIQEAEVIELIEPEVTEEEAVEADYDAEIAAIFTEESAELLEAADQALGEWSKDTSSRAAVEELKRHLHTLKGGARSAPSPDCWKPIRPSCL